MDLVTEAVDYLLNDPDLQKWNTATELIKYIAHRPASHWKIPEAACKAVGGTQQQAIPAVSAIIALHSAIIMVDDILDKDGRFTDLGFSDGDIANLALTLQASALKAISRSETGVETKIQITSALNRMIVLTSTGQHLDSHTQIENEKEYWNIARQKSSPFFAGAFYSGALIGGASFDAADRLAEIGSIFGEMIQIHDDLKDALESPASQDWAAGHASLPILFAATVNHPQKQQFNKLRAKVFEDEPSLKTAQSIMIHCGAISYCAKELLQRNDLVRKKTSEIRLIDPGALNLLFDRVIEPVIHLFKLVGVSAPEF
ncbi:MAG: polyprenyl synthetase family protein [Anaerolineae bacterium]|nr:polyprenyl synthetase family protein [Anaerolineae bacterium]